MNKLVSLQAADDFLARLDKKRCPWCDGNEWALRGTTQTDPTSEQNVAGIRSLAETRLYLVDDEVKGEIKLGADGALPVLTVRCDRCGYLYLFDYFKVVELFYNNTPLKADDNGEKNEITSD